jgi:hypothetical protein
MVETAVCGASSAQPELSSRTKIVYPPLLYRRCRRGRLLPPASLSLFLSVIQLHLRPGFLHESRKNAGVKIFERDV